MTHQPDESVAAKAQLEDVAQARPSGVVSDDLLAWYDVHRRRLPWRAEPGVRPDPYAVWLSEIMLQQTTVKAVKPYFERFLARWPIVTDLADAPLEDVLGAWAGLGYYARARNLHKAAQAVRDDHKGRFPGTEAELRQLPGIGPYTAAAIASIAFGEAATPVDGNIERVVARLFRVETPLPAAKPELKRLAATLTPPNRPGDHAQAMMDLGATICTPKSPACVICPVCKHCAAFRSGAPASVPRKTPKPPKPHRRGAAFCIMREDGAILLRRRPPRGLLGGMAELPGTPWLETVETGTEPGNTEHQATRADWGQAPLTLRYIRAPSPVRHVFTHFTLDLTIWIGRCTQSTKAPPGHWWSPRASWTEEALPSVMRKAIDAAVAA